MALVVKDRVKESSTTSGTGTLTLAGAVTGFQAFSAALSNGDTTYYAIAESSTGAWEVGLGTYTTSGTTLARTTVLSSSNSGSAINLSGAGSEVFITQPAGKAAYFDAAGDLYLNQDPTSALQSATKQYVDTIAAAGIHYHDPVRVEREGNLTATYNNGTAGVGATLTNSGTQAALVIDGVTLNSADRVLVYEQTNATQNGIYTVTNTGSASTNWVLTRATDADSYGPSDPDSLGQGDAFFVQEGAAGAGETYVMNTEGTITFGTTNITFAQFSSAQIYSAGNGLTLTGVTFAAGAGTGVTVNANDIAIGQDVGTSADVTFNTVSANLTGNVTGSVTGNASTASALQTARNIALTGAVTGSTSFDGSGNVSITTTATSDPTITLGGDLSGSATLTNLGNATLTATINANSVALGTDTTGNYVGSGATSGNGISGSVSSEGGTFTVTSNATNANTGSTLVFRDASGNFSAGTITAALSGNASTATSAAALTTARNIALSGAVTGDANFDGSGNITISTTATSDPTLTLNGDATGSATFTNLGNATLTVTVVDDSHNHVISNVDGLQTALDGKLSTSGKAADSDLLDGYNSSQSESSNTVAVRNANGYLFSSYFNGTGTFSTTGDTSGMARFTGTNGSDTYGRSYTAAAARSLLNVADGATNVTNNNQLTNGAGYTTYTSNQATDTTSNVTHNRVTGTEYVYSPTMYLDGVLYHNGDTDTYLQFDAANSFRIVTGNSQRVKVDSTGVQLGDSGNGYFQPVSGDYGSIQIDGGGHNGWEGYSIGGRVVLMHDNSSTFGIYNDVNNEWMVQCLLNGAVNLYHNGASKLQTTSSGVNISGTAECDTLQFSDGSTQTSAGASTGKAIAMAIVFG